MRLPYLLAPRTWSDVAILARQFAAHVPEPTDCASEPASEEKDKEDAKCIRDIEPNRNKCYEQNGNASEANKVEHEHGQRLVD